MKTYKITLTFDVDIEDNSVEEKGIENCIEDIKYHYTSEVYKNLNCTMVEKNSFPLPPEVKRDN